MGAAQAENQGNHPQSTPKTVQERIGALNQLMRGWVNYFKHATGYQSSRIWTPGYAAGCATVSGSNGSGPNADCGPFCN
ncbi:MAG: hypothetical protein H6559_03305 [Lewinellaceae bacterium]|nr:hypothetical protein [Lewinellaceae bacterium]